MRISMQKAVVFLLLATCFTVHSDESACEYRGESIPIGKSLFVKDPALVKRGLPRDWQGRVIRCTRVVVSTDTTKNPDAVSGGIKLGHPVLVVSELYENFYIKIKQ